jgi:RNA polymerase sigma factor (TIGR02999 family)
MDESRSMGRHAVDRLVPSVYDRLRGLARRHLRRLGAGHTLDTTGLVHEAYLKLAASPTFRPQSEGHLLAVTIRAMRQVLVSRARARLAVKRDQRQPGAREPSAGAQERDAEQVLDLDRALGRLQRDSPALAEIFECRYFGALGEEETARALGCSLRSVQRGWMRARAWLRAELAEGGGRRELAR